MHRSDKEISRCLRRRDDNIPTLSMTGTHAIANRRQNSLSEAILPVFTPCEPSWTVQRLWDLFRELSRLCNFFSNDRPNFMTEFSTLSILSLFHIFIQYLTYFPKRCPQISIPSFDLFCFPNGRSL